MKSTLPLKSRLLAGPEPVLHVDVSPEQDIVVRAVLGNRAIRLTVSFIHAMAAGKHLDASLHRRETPSVPQNGPIQIAPAPEGLVAITLQGRPDPCVLYANRAEGAAFASLLRAAAIYRRVCDRDEIN